MKGNFNIIFRYLFAKLILLIDYYVPGLGVPMLATPLLTLNDFDGKGWFVILILYLSSMFVLFLIFFYFYFRWMLEKYDGIRAFWSPAEKQFLSRSGRKLPVDASVRDLFSNVDFWLDGEIWYFCFHLFLLKTNESDAIN